jgi:branched-chain amino acid transport system permease protein
VLILIGINIIMASSFNLIIGFGGLISIAHPIFFALAGYCSAILAMKFGVPIPLAILLGTLFRQRCRSRCRCPACASRATTC